MNYHAQIISDLPAVVRLESEWRQLEAVVTENIGFFASWAYTHTYLTRHAPNEWCVVVIRGSEQGPLEAVFPLEIRVLEHLGLRYRCANPLGVIYLPYIEFLVRSSHRRDILNVLLGDVLRQHLNIDLACFWPLHEKSALYLTLLEDLGGGPALKALRFPDNLNEIEGQGGNFDAYVRSRPSKTFADARYCERRMQREGRLEFCVAENDPEGILLEQLCARNSAQFQHNHAYANSPDWRRYLCALYQTLDPLGLAQLVTLRFNAQVISSALVFCFKGRRYLYMYAYDAAYAKYSPSKVLLANLIEQIFREGSVLCFGAGSQAYKRDWGQSVGELKAAIVFLNPEARTALDDALVPGNMYRLFGV